VYKRIVKYKTSFYTFYLPLRLATVYMNCEQDEGTVEELKAWAFKVGYLFQVQDDFLDCFGDSKNTGKIGNDIQEGKCSWLVVNALEIIGENKDTKAWLTENYGIKNEAAAERVKDLYTELGLEERYRQLEEELLTEIQCTVDKMKLSEIKPLLVDVVNCIHLRCR
jgi:farnesyl diphosphate synthase